MPMFIPNSRIRQERTKRLLVHRARGNCGGGGLNSATGDAENLVLKMMMEAVKSVEVPSVFICPISLDTMVDPVTLCTGQTYERSNILKWFSLGHYTCPTTMQQIWDYTVTPNRTLQQLYYTWVSQEYFALKKRSGDVQGRVIELLDDLKKVKGGARVQALKELRQLVSANPSAKKAVLNYGGNGIALVISLLGSFTTHAVGSEAVGILVNFHLDFTSRANLLQPAKVSLLVDMLNEGSIETKINCTKLIQILIEGKDFDSEMVSSLSLLVGLLRLVKGKRHPDGVLAGFSLLKRLCSRESIRGSFVSIGAIPQLVELLPSLNNECLELAFYILEVLSTIPDGKLALKDCVNTIPSTVKFLMKVSEKCTQNALSILRAVFQLAPDECAALALEAGAPSKLLLVLQSGCEPEVKQRSAELLKLCSLNYTPTIFVSKCKLTKTIR